MSKYRIREDVRNDGLRLFIIEQLFILPYPEYRTFSILPNYINKEIWVLVDISKYSKHKALDTLVEAKEMLDKIKGEKVTERIYHEV